MAGHRGRNLSVRCAVNQFGRATCEISQHGSPTAITSVTSVTAKFPFQRSKLMRGRHDVVDLRVECHDSRPDMLPLKPLGSAVPTISIRVRHWRLWQSASPDQDGGTIMSLSRRHVLDSVTLAIGATALITR